jgi:hypothetical protein
MSDLGRVQYLFSRNAVHKRFLHTFSSNLSYDKIWEARLECDKKIKHCGL